MFHYITKKTNVALIILLGLPFIHIDVILICQVLIYLKKFMLIGLYIFNILSIYLFFQIKGVYIRSKCDKYKEMKN